MSTTAIALPPMKEVEKSNKQVVALQEQAATLTVESHKDLETAATFLERVKEMETSISSRREEITRPLMSALSSVRDLFKPLETGLRSAKDMVKQKVVAYHTAEQERLDKKQEDIQARVDAGKMKVETALGKLEEISPVPSKVGKMQSRTITKVRITDESLIPREYLVPNMTKITEAVLRGGLKVPGVEAYKTKIVAV